MVYHRPEILHTGSALNLVQGSSTQKWSAYSDNQTSMQNITCLPQEEDD
jgi:hypothetical protein